MDDASYNKDDGRRVAVTMGIRRGRKRMVVMRTTWVIKTTAIR